MPQKFSKIIRINSAERREEKPFNLEACVRSDCSAIIEEKKEVKRKERLGWAHKTGCSKKIAVIFKSQNKEEEKLKIDLVAGSKVEKMSTIIERLFKDKVDIKNLEVYFKHVKLLG